MALLFLILGIASLAVSFYFYSKKEKIEFTIDEINKKKGNDFEEYIIQLLGKQNDIKFVGKVSDYHKNGISALENMEPDLKFKYKNVAFAVECKWRQSFGNDYIFWAKERQIRNYNDYQKNKKEKVYIALGFGGEPSKPDHLYLVPLSVIKYETFKKEYVADFEVKDEAEILKFIKKQTKF
ncbi:hypothetical protein IV494_00265 [Kaistella sp. G5-32]|uniref:Restriction endonuclease n=1 Tax=Kaistella gelatinilytica TaxID=2787636 RepID=A0ABS0F7B8_9FLAO|nr:hypothetical protein [Kaistella gelatinilytica]MBF8455601.1 hypothetical protein [Kaistella gelatinilytica]